MISVVVVRWISWLRRASPPTWAFEALLENEFRSLSLTCSSSQLVPSGLVRALTPCFPLLLVLTSPSLSVVALVLHRRRLSGLHDNWRGTWLGNRLWAGLREFSLKSRPFGQSMRLTSLLISQISAKYGVAAGNIWRNVGILWAMFVGYTLLVILGSSLLIKDNGSTSGKIFDRPLFPKKESASAPVVDEKKAAPELDESKDVKDFSQAPVFTYQSVDYTVQVDGKDKKLLDSVSGLVQPGKIRALMGASGSSASFFFVFSLRRSLADLLLFPVRPGAGKTTLLECISQRKTTGRLEGEFLIDGQSLDSAFSRRTGFVMQGDVHEPMSTVRECLQVSLSCWRIDVRSRSTADKSSLSTCARL